MQALKMTVGENMIKKILGSFIHATHCTVTCGITGKLFVVVVDIKFSKCTKEILISTEKSA